MRVRAPLLNAADFCPAAIRSGGTRGIISPEGWVGNDDVGSIEDFTPKDAMQRDHALARPFPPWPQRWPLS
ncbi:hypothetical protein J2S55_006877 [Streptosporangium brasiliense]|uniref:Uncharacterized protein n=1 Tax=Streptosporangium brasiliense TaxID=47480 RepID=A0ABT9REC6_9ACTN|nr:hypothetical protein [Streptosporangium brasiliense]